MVLANATQIHQIIMNLGTNAAHAMRKQPGTMTVKLQRVLITAAECMGRTGLSPGPYVRLSIADAGQGMDAQTKQRIFEPFFTTKGPGEGTGLGLSVVHGIIQSHKGFIEVTSEVGHGALFEICFPAIADSELIMAPVTTQLLRGNGEEILLVDDEASLLWMGRKVLEKLGYVVTTATDPTIALNYVETDPSRFSLVITDLTMPQMTGLELAARVHKLRPELSIILATGNDTTIPPESFRTCGIADVLLKPFTISMISEKARALLDSRSQHQSI
jgi:CheY-like chemotaxis protein